MSVTPHHERPSGLVALPVSQNVDVTFPVTIRLEPGTTANPRALGQIREALASLVETACEEGSTREAQTLRAHTPDDDGDGSFSVMVREPTIEARHTTFHLIGVDPTVAR